MSKRFALITFLSFGISFVCRSQTPDKFNPVIPGDFADPSIIRSGTTYYATGTSSEWAPQYPVFASTDLVNWKQTGFIFNQKPAWASSSFWAPELFFHKGKYYCYYVARRKSDGISCIGVAVSDSPEKEFTDKGVLLAFGKEAIDPFVIEVKGKLYMSFKAYGLDPRPIELLAIQLSDDGLKTAGEPFSLLKDDEHKLMEGECIIKNDGWYYILYSPGGCCGVTCSYEVRVARSRNFEGPYEKFTQPLLSEDETWKCPGHGTVVQSATNKFYYLYHAYNKIDNVFAGRQGMLKEMFWDKSTGWPYFKIPVGLPTRKEALTTGFTDNFARNNLQPCWQWDVMYSKPSVKTGTGKLLLSPASDTANRIGAAITVRPYLGNYEISVNGLQGSPGLVVYADAANAVVLEIAHGSLEAVLVRKGKETSLGKRSLGTESAGLKIIVTGGLKYTFQYQKPGGAWTDFNVSGFEGFMPPWDRSSRAGLINRGKEMAVFSGFHLGYERLSQLTSGL